MYIPETQVRFNCFKIIQPMVISLSVYYFQDPAPLTEDVLEEQSRVMISLGDDAQGSELRAKMMSASLHSDMESFKVNCRLKLCMRFGFASI